MACFNRVYSCGSQPIDDHSKITIRHADAGKCAQVTRWLKWIVQLPIEVSHMIHTVGLMIKNQEMIIPVQKQLVQDRAIHRMASPTGSQHIVTSTRIANEILRHYRNDEDGLFSFGAKGDNARLFLPVLQDIVEEPVNLEDFLFTCHSRQAKVCREAILDFFGPKNLPVLRERLKEIVKSALIHLEKQEVDGVIHCSARELTGTFTVAVVSNLLLGKEAANFADYQPISQAISVCMEHAMMKFVWMKPTPQQERAYQDALKVLRDTINHSEGDFLNALKDTGMTDVQRKGVLFLMYIAGGETSSSLLEYMLWQLGQHPEYQNEIFESIKQAKHEPGSIMDRVLQESLRLHTPTAFICRTPRTDLEVHVENSDKSHWKYLLPKGQNVLVTPYFAGRNPATCHEPNLFDPHREESVKNASLPWNVFGRGKHGCPGKWLALTEIRALTEALLERYEVESGPMQVPRQKQLLTITLDPQVSLTLKRRNHL